MAEIAIDTVAYDLGDGNTGYHGVVKSGQPVEDEEFMQAVIDAS